jgi:hypothetical protein
MEQFMSEQDEEHLEIELEPLESEKTEEIKVEKTEEPPKKEISADEGIRELKLKLEEERLARLEAERQMKRATETASAAKSEVDDTNLKLIDNAIETVKNNQLALKRSYAEALSKGDHEEAAEIQIQLSEMAVQKMQLENGKTAYQSRIEQTKSAPPVQNDPVEMLASQLSSRSADWVRAHPEYATNPRLYQKMIAAHNLAMADGLEADSDDYFNTIEETLKIPSRNSIPHEDSALSAASAPTSRRSAPPAAPVSRSPTTNSGTRPNVVRLNAQEREMASMMGMTDQEYARNKAALIKEGKLN